MFLLKSAPPAVPTRIGLVNARLLANKTFILKDFFTSRGLEFLYVTETWLRVGESSVFYEHLPNDCFYLKCSAIKTNQWLGGGIERAHGCAAHHSPPK